MTRAGHSAYWRLRTFGFTPQQAVALVRAGYDVTFIPVAAVGL